jgi:RNA polymerase-binding protein DksA
MIPASVHTTKAKAGAIKTPAKSAGRAVVSKSATSKLSTAAAGHADRHTAGAGSSARFPNNSPLPQAPVPTQGKPKKNLAGMGVRDLEHYRELLLGKRRELVGDMTSMEREALRSANGTNLSNLPLHMADMGTDNYEQEFTLGLVEKERGLLRELNRALAKIQDGTYGICEGTGKPINRPRLEAQPWARFSIEYARMMERGLVRR